MIIYPAIDILNGRCVRLIKGDYDRVTIYSDNPLEFVSKWTNAGAGFIHVVDLNGARSGSPVNNEIIRGIVKESGVPVQTGGGIRNLERIKELVDMGVSRIILGTIAVTNPEIVDEAVGLFGDAIAVGVDARNGFVATDGWKINSGKKALEFAKEMEDRGVGTLIYTDIATDGMLGGPNLNAMKEMSSAVGCNIIASGGVSCIKDLISLEATGVAGVIVGRALYEGKLDLEEAIAAIGGG